jgi:hypothetical protein
VNLKRHALIAILALASLTAGCRKKHKDDDEPKAKPAAAKPRPAKPAKPTFAAPFDGTYTKVAEATWKNGRRVRVANANGSATLKIEGGRVTYAQTYTMRGKVNHVTQIYTFGPESMKPVQGGGYDVAIVYQSISGDTQNYSPDKNNPKLEARKQVAGWSLGLITTDNNGVMGGVEFK